MKTILFVCTQNVFRSYSAHKLFELYLAQKKELHNFRILSAGTEAYPDRPYSYTIEALEHLGITNLNHTQTRLSQNLVDNADVIICMTNQHKRIIQERFGFDAILINEIAYNKATDLEDDDETSGYATLKGFVELTIDKINKAIPSIYEYVKNENLYK